MQTLNSSSSVDDNKLYNNFIYSLKSEVTKERYLTNLKYYIKFLGTTTLSELVNKPQKIIESDIKEYLVYLRYQKKNIIPFCSFIFVSFKEILLRKYRLSIQMGSYNFVFGK